MRLFMLALLLLPFHAAGQQWVDMADEPVFSSAVDASSIRKTYSYTEAWVRGNNTDKGETGSYLAQLQFKCEERSYATRAVVGYSGRNGTGKVVSQNYPPYQTFQPAIPGSVGSNWLKFVCAYAAKEDWAIAAANAGGYRQLIERAKALTNVSPKGEEEELAAAERAAGISTTATAPGKVDVASVTLGSAIDESYRIPIPRTRFWPLETIYASVITDADGEKPIAGNLRAYWYYENDGQLVYQRYYDPTIGRFLSVDPVTATTVNGSNFNRYWYANNNPYKFTDPDGRFGVIGGLIGAGIEAGMQLATDGKITNPTAVVVAGAVGMVTGGVGGLLGKAAVSGTITAGKAAVTTGLVGAAPSANGKLAEGAITGTPVSSREVAGAALTGGVGAGVGARIGLNAVAKTEKMAAAGGIAGYVGRTTQAAVQQGGKVVEPSTSFTQKAAQTTVDTAASAAEKRLNK